MIDMHRLSEQTSSANPKVSVAMITYNHERFIAQAIESVLMQETDFPVELIIGEDCSTDSTRRIVEEYARKYPNVIRAIIHERNVGMSNNAVAAESACRGQYEACLEGDDYWIHPRKLQKQAQLMDANPHYSMCGTATKIIARAADGTEKDAGLIRPISLKPNYDLRDFLQGYPMHTSSVLIRRGMVAFPQWMTEVINRDTCVFALHAEKGPAGFLDEVMSCYRLHCGGIWTGKSILTRNRCQRVTYDALDTYFNGRYHRLLRQLECRSSMAASRALAERETPLDARKIYWEAVPRMLFLMPFTMSAWGLAVYGGYRCKITWDNLTTFLAIRTRLRHMMQRFPTHADHK